MGSKKNTGKADWLREMREKQFDDRVSKRSSQQPDRKPAGKGDSKGGKG